MQIIRSKRKTISVEIKRDLSVLVRAPLSMSDKKIAQFVARKSGWINKHIEKLRQHNEKNAGQSKFTDEEIQNLAQKAREILLQKVRHYASVIGVDFNRITVRNQTTRWGSCSAKGNLNFNYLLMLTPPEVIDYVVVHELCHLKELNHSKRFWDEVRSILPDYEQNKKWLKEKGSELIDRLK